MRAAIIAVAIVLCTISGCESNEAASARGRREAERDLQDGKSRLFWRGKPMDEKEEYARLLKDKLKVTLTFEPEARYLWSQEVAFQSGYNRRIQEKFAKGKATIKMVKEEAKKMYEARMKREAGPGEK